MSNTDLLHAHIELFRELLRQGKDAKARGLNFKVYLVDGYLHRVYDELDGPLTDDIAAIPPS